MSESSLTLSLGKKKKKKKEKVLNLPSKYFGLDFLNLRQRERKDKTLKGKI